MGLYFTPLLQHIYNIPINPRIHKYYISINYVHDAYMTPGNIYRTHAYSHNTTRVVVHIACICKKKGVDQFMNRIRFYTSGCIYLYLRIIRAPIRGPFFPIDAKILKIVKWQPSFFKTLLASRKIYTYFCLNHLISIEAVL